MTQESHPEGGFAGHTLQVAIKAQFGVDLHPQDVDGVLDGKGVMLFKLGKETPVPHMVESPSEVQGNHKRGVARVHGVVPCLGEEEEQVSS